MIDVRTGRDILETHNGSAAMESSDSNVLSYEVQSDLLKEKKMKKRTEKLAKIQKLKGEQAEGKKLEKNQVEMISKENEVSEEIQLLQL